MKDLIRSDHNFKLEHHKKLHLLKVLFNQFQFAKAHNSRLFSKQLNEYKTSKNPAFISWFIIFFAKNCNQFFVTMRKLFSFFAYNDNEIIGILKCVHNGKKGGCLHAEWFWSNKSNCMWWHSFMLMYISCTLGVFPRVQLIQLVKDDFCCQHKFTILLHAKFYSSLFKKRKTFIQMKFLHFSDETIDGISF